MFALRTLRADFTGWLAVRVDNLDSLPGAHPLEGARFRLSEAGQARCFEVAALLTVRRQCGFGSVGHPDLHDVADDPVGQRHARLLANAGTSGRPGRLRNGWQPPCTTAGRSGTGGCRQPQRPTEGPCSSRSGTRGCCRTWRASTARDSPHPTSGPRCATSTSTPRGGGWRPGPSGTPSSCPAASSSRGTSAAGSSIWHFPPGRSISPSAWIAGSCRSWTARVSSGQRDGFARCGPQVTTSSAAATPPGRCRGRSSRAFTWPSRSRRATSKSSCGRGPSLMVHSS
jgi:hypothetical protein